MTEHSGLASALLFAGMIAGAALAAAGILRHSGEAALPADVVAMVGETPISHAEYERALRSVEAERRRPLDEDGRQQVLNQLIGEALLVERGLQLGLAGRDPRLRAELSAAVIGLIVAQAEAESAPTEAELRAFYDERRRQFSHSDRYVVEHLFIAVDASTSDSEARARAAELAARWGAGASVGDLRDEADRVVAELPDGWAAEATLREYLGPSVVSAVAQLEQHEVSEPVRSFGGYHIVRLVERRSGDVRPFAEVEGDVRAAYRRWVGEQSVADFIERRRREAGVSVREER